MLDIRLIREDADAVKKALARRNKDYAPIVDNILEIDARRREVSSRADGMRSEQNKANKKIPAIKQAGGDISALMAEMKELSENIKECASEIAELEQRQRDLLLNIPNLPNPEIPDGVDDSQNRELRRVGEPPAFSFDPKPHWDLGAALGILDPETAAKVTGARFHFLKGYGARLERSIVSYFLNTHTEHGYTEVFPPFMVNRASMTGTGQLPKFEDDAYKLANEDYFLIPTAEVPVTNMFRDDILNGKELPLRYAAYSACFRGEVGAAGRDQKGVIRQHQFNKVELVKFTKPEDSYAELERLTNDAERVLQGLGLAYRVVCLCAGDLGFSSAKTYDIEVWMPSYNRYVEISSCSNFESYQARRANIRYKESAKDKAQFVHTLNGSGVAVGRTLAAILENYQNQDGSITVPEALRPYMGTDVIR